MLYKPCPISVWTICTVGAERGGIIFLSWIFNIELHWIRGYAWCQIDLSPVTFAFCLLVHQAKNGPDYVMWRSTQSLMLYLPAQGLGWCHSDLSEWTFVSIFASTPFLSKSWITLLNLWFVICWKNDNGAHKWSSFVDMSGVFRSKLVPTGIINSGLYLWLLVISLFLFTLSLILLLSLASIFF